ncbi:MAG: hypothetical protein NW226_06710 [Microscillaceae bacterium]|nr:hypothetical protein [Microscillaceae bacterium]
MIVRLITPLPNTAGTLSVIAVDANNQIIITDIVDNIGGATSDNNPNLYSQLWEKITNNVYTTFRNLKYNAYLSCSNGAATYTFLTTNSAISDSCKWVLSQQGPMPGDDPGAPLSYAIQAYQNTNQVIDLQAYSTVPGNKPWMYFWKGNPPSDGSYNQFWYLEEPRIEVHNPGGHAVDIAISNDVYENIQVWDAMIGGNLIIGAGLNTTITVPAGYTSFYISSKKYNTGHYVNESENESDQVIDLSPNTPHTVQFYYGDPKAGATISISVER